MVSTVSRRSKPTMGRCPPQSPTRRAVAAGSTYFNLIHAFFCATAVLPGIDVKSIGGYIVAPPSRHPVTGNRYRWRTGFGPGEIEIAMAPEWLVALVEPVELPEPPRKPETIKAVHLGRYAEAALASACENIARASPGAQEITLGREAFGIGRLVAADVIPRGAAKARLIAAGERMSSDPKRRKWTREQITRRVERSIVAAASSPRTPEPVH